MTLKYPAIPFVRDTPTALRRPSMQANLFIRILQIIISTVVLGIAGYNLQVKAIGVQAIWIYLVVVSGTSLLLTLCFLVCIARYTAREYYATHSIWCVLWLAALSAHLHYILTPPPCANSAINDKSDIKDIIECFEQNTCDRETVLLSFILAAVIVWLGCAVFYSTATYIRRISCTGVSVGALASKEDRNRIVEKTYEEDRPARQSSSPIAPSNR
ncbi:uncharacterized protein V1513DRAFT_432762 [Lipomyces chichibuensis]|uniref:uncharacterized protein n=1 Tax=Lipomyces chichibuensis TaxID=1546026 RepID=UPI003343C6BD